MLCRAILHIIVRKSPILGYRPSLLALSILLLQSCGLPFPGGPKWQAADGVLDHVAALGRALHAPALLAEEAGHRTSVWLPDLTCSVDINGVPDMRTSIQELCQVATAECFQEIHVMDPSASNVNPACSFERAVTYFRRHCYASDGTAPPIGKPPAICSQEESAPQRCYEAYTSNSDSADTSKLSSVLGRLDDAFSFTRLNGLFAIHGGQENTQASYRKGDPFPHIMFEEILPGEVLEQIQHELPSLSVCELAALSALGWRKSFIDPSWHWLKWTLPLVRSNEDKILPDSTFGPVGRALLGHLRGQPFLTFLERLTGIGPLLPDPYLFGGGLHEISSGGYLGLHVDFSRHPVYENFERRVNVFLFLNPLDWPAEWGGALELWRMNSGSVASGACFVRILPHGGRMVIFSTSDMAFHGHPWPLAVPANVTRRSLALYYYKMAGPGRWFHRVVDEPGWSGETYVVDVQCKDQDDPKCYGSTVTV